MTDKNATANYAYLFVDYKWRLFRKNDDLFIDVYKRQTIGVSIVQFAALRIKTRAKRNNKNKIRLNRLSMQNKISLGKLIITNINND